MANRKRIPTEQRYWAKVDRSGGPDACWPWLGSCNRGGYGEFWDGTYRSNGSPTGGTAHRWAHQAFVRALRVDECVLHICDNPPCQNPAHWFIGSHADNAADRQAKGRSRGGGPGLPGSRNGAAKLDDAAVLEIRRLIASGVTHRQIRATFGISAGLVSAIRTRKLWRHI